MNPQRRLLWFRRLALAGAILAAAVVVLGAWVRLTDAGLGCPDWPGCYGHIYPNAGQTAAEAGSHFAKALHEMIHRYFATTLGIIITSLLVWALLGRGAARLLHSSRRLRAFNIAMALLLVASIVPVLIES